MTFNEKDKPFSNWKIYFMYFFEISREFKQLLRVWQTILQVLTYAFSYLRQAIFVAIILMLSTTNPPAQFAFLLDIIQQKRMLISS